MPCNTQQCPTFERIAQGLECKVDEKDVGYDEGQKNCAEKSKDVGSRYFIYGRDSSLCRDGNFQNQGLFKECKCYAEVPGKKDCQVTPHSSYDLYQNFNGRLGDGNFFFWSSPIRNMFTVSQAAKTRHHLFDFGNHALQPCPSRGTRGLVAIQLANGTCLLILCIRLI